MKQEKLFGIIALSAVTLLLLANVVAGILEMSGITITNPATLAQVNVIMKIFGFCVFLILGFSLPPIFIGRFFRSFLNMQKTQGDSTHPMVQSLQANQVTLTRNLVRALWIIYIVGLIIMFPAVVQNIFFS